MKLGVQHLDDSWFLVFLFSTQALNRSFHSHFFEEVHVARAAAAFGIICLSFTYFRGSGVGEKTVLQPADKTGYPMLEQLKR